MLYEVAETQDVHCLETNRIPYPYMSLINKTYFMSYKAHLRLNIKKTDISYVTHEIEEKEMRAPTTSILNES